MASGVAGRVICRWMGMVTPVSVTTSDSANGDCAWGLRGLKGLRARAGRARCLVRAWLGLLRIAGQGQAEVLAGGGGLVGGAAVFARQPFEGGLHVAQEGRAAVAIRQVDV